MNNADCTIQGESKIGKWQMETVQTLIRLFLSNTKLHMECSNGAVKTAFDIQTVGKRGPGDDTMTWKQLTERDCREWKLSAIDPHDRESGDLV